MPKDANNVSRPLENGPFSRLFQPLSGERLPGAVLYDDEFEGTQGDDTITGTEGDDEIEGGKGDDLLSGLGGDDEIEGGQGNDTISGGAGEDEIEGGKGDDVIDGGGGDDEIEGGQGNDLIDAGMGNDEIEAGPGDDTVRGGEGNDEMEGGPGYDTAVYDGSIFDFLISQDDDDDIVEDTNAADGDEGTDTLESFEALQFADYTYIIDGDNAALILADDQTTDEDNSESFTVDAFDFDGGTVSLDSATVSGGGTLTVDGSAMVTQGNYDGTRYSITFDPAGAYEYLAVTESTTETVTLTVSDGQGNIAVDTLEVTITGVNDSVVVDAGASDFVGAATEDASDPLTDTGSIAFSDVDVSDTHTVSATVASITGSTGGFDAATAAGFMTLGVSDTAGVTDGTVTWDFSADNALFQYLADGDTVTIAYDVTIDDGNGGAATETVEVTVTGENDAPTITAGPDIVMTEDDGAVLMGSSLATTFDVDQGDTHSYEVRWLSIYPASAAGLPPSSVIIPEAENATLVEVDPTLGIADTGTASLDVAYDANVFQYLATGESIVISYELKIIDNNGAESIDDVVATVTGVNDDVTIDAGLSDLTGAATEDANDPLTDSGSLAFFDVDLTDTHTATVAVNGISGVVGSFDAATAAGLFAVSVSEGANSDNGTVTWTFSADNALFQYLAEGETVTIGYEVTVADGNGGSDVETVEVTVTGVNDDPEIVAGGDVTGDVTEETDLIATGALAATDIDASDTLTWSVQGGGVGSHGTLTVDQNGNWTFMLDNDDEDVQNLDAGQFLEESFTIQVDDGNGGIASQLVTMTINGTDDAGGNNPILYTFEDGLNGSGPGGVVFDGGWQTRASTGGGRAPNGYDTGVVSGDHIVFNSGGNPVSISRAAAFDLESAYLTAAWNNGMTFRAIGYDEFGVMIGQEDFIINQAGPIFAEFDDTIFDSVYAVEFQTFGGTDANGADGGAGTHFAMDDLLILG